MTARPPLPPFDMQKALQKVQAAEDAWNTCDPERVALAYTEDSVWRNRDRFVTGRLEIIEFLRQKWQRELDYALRKELWAFGETRIGVRFQYESRDLSGQYWRSYGNELWVLGAAFDPMQVMTSDLIFGGRSILGSLTGTPVENEANMAFSAARGVTPMIELFDFQDAPKAYERMMSGDARFRVVLDITAEERSD